MNDAPAAPALRPWHAFQFRDFRFIWATGLLAVMSQWIRILVMAQWLFEATGSAAQLGLIGGVQLVVQIPALLWGGAIADVLDRKKVVLFAQLTTCSVFLMLGFADSAGALQPWHVYIAIAATAITQMVGQPATAALVPATVPERHLMLAVTTVTATQNIGSIAGPLLFAGVAAFAGVTEAFFVGAAVTLPAAFLPLFIRVAGRTENATTGSMISRVWEGFRFATRHPILPGLFLLDTGITVVSFYREILPVLAKGFFKGGAGAVGVLGAANSAGAVVGSFVALFLADFRAKGMLVLFASMAYAIFLFGFSAMNTLWLGAIFIALIGAADSVTVAVRMTTVQLTTPDNMRGRAYAFLVLVAQTANNIGTLWVGLWSEVIGAQRTMLMGSFLAMGATLLIWRLWRPIREYRG
ncbi:MAG: MFS transporter [Dehalococcoidia bacterium]|nr:MFS transporter [Dehalococcoidia bacterium]MCB9487008.1 MFS transporter [Thermoflexaceae bacterium]